MGTRHAMLIDGRLVQASTGATMKIINPADGKASAVAPKGSPVEIDEAVGAAWRTGAGWAAKYVAERAKEAPRRTRQRA